MPIDGYIRVSQVKGRSGASFISPAVQRERIEAWAKLQGAVLGEVFEELDESGARKDRPLLIEALRRVESGESQGLVVARLDRFGRSLTDSLAAIERIQAAGGTFASVGDGLDLSTDTGKLVLRIMLSMAEWELDRIRSQWDVARERAVARGVHLGSRRPAGYVRGKGGRLRPHPQEGKAITELFRRRAEGASVRQLCRWLDSLELPTVTGNRHWTDSTVGHILENRVYLGESRHGAFLNDHAHQPLVDAVIWQRAQLPRVIRPARPGLTPSLLAGLLRCGGCSLSMGAALSRRSGRKTRNYVCLGRSSAGRCPARACVSATVVEPYVEEVAFALARRRERLAPDRRALERLEHQVKEADSALACYRDEPRFQRTLGEERYVAGLTIRRERVERLLAEIGAERARTGPSAAAKALEERWAELAVEERREALAELIDCVYVMRGDREPDERLFVCARGEGPRELPARGGRGRGARPFDPSECRRTRPAAAVSPRRGASWSEERIRATLAAFLERDAHTAWPLDEVFLAAGHGRLIEQVWCSGGPQRWAREVGVAPDRSRHTHARWSERRALGTLTVFLRGRRKWPTRRQFAAAGYDGLHDWLCRRGGVKAWSRRYGLPIAWQEGPRRWSEGAIEGALLELIGDEAIYPRYVDFQSAGLGGLYATVNAGHGHDWWARRLGVPRRRRGPARAHREGEAPRGARSMSTR